MKQKFLLILELILIISYFLQYSGIVLRYFMTFKVRKFRYFGAIIEVIPYAVVGLTLASCNLMNKIKEKKKKVFVTIIIYFFIKNMILLEILEDLDIQAFLKMYKEFLFQFAFHSFHLQKNLKFYLLLNILQIILAEYIICISLL